jgi:hypothetical protein
MSLLNHLARWLCPPIGVVVIALVAVFPLLLGVTTPYVMRDCFLFGGLLLSIAGFVIVWWQVVQSLAKHGRPSFRARVKRWWAARHMRPVTAGGSAVLDAMTTEAHAIVRTGKDDNSPHSRLRALEENLKNLDDDVAAFRASTVKRFSDLAAELKVETQRRHAATEDLSTRLADTAVGGADWQFVGLIWFITGTIFLALSGWSHLAP